MCTIPRILIHFTFLLSLSLRPNLGIILVRNFNSAERKEKKRRTKRKELRKGKLNEKMITKEMKMSTKRTKD